MHIATHRHLLVSYKLKTQQRFYIWSFIGMIPLHNWQEKSIVPSFLILAPPDGLKPDPMLEVYHNTILELQRRFHLWSVGTRIAGRGGSVQA